MTVFYILFILYYIILYYIILYYIILYYIILYYIILYYIIACRQTLKASPVAYSIGTGDCFLGVKEGGALKLTTQPHPVSNSRMS